MTPFRPAAPLLRLQISHVTLSIGDRVLLHDLNATFGPGVNLVQGGDGRGKTSLLRMLAGLMPPDSGQVVLNGADMAAQAGTYLSQLFWMEPQSTAFDAVSGLTYLQQMRERYPHFDPDVADALIDDLSLADHIEKPLYMLSTGSKRKVWFCAAFASGAPLTLLDMPFAALDKASIVAVTGRLSEQAQRAQRIWVVTDYAPPPGVAIAATIDLGD